MTKADTVRLLSAERCSVIEIAAAVGWKPSVVQDFLRDRLVLPSPANRAFMRWRCSPLARQVVSL